MPVHTIILQAHGLRLRMCNHCTKVGGMPTLIRLPDCTIHLYAGDHLPPHFHVRMRDGREVLIEIADFNMLRGHVPQRELQGALDWARDHQTELSAKWSELNP